MKKYAYQNIENINKNIFNNFKKKKNIFRGTHTLLFQKLPSRHTTPTRATPTPALAPALEPKPKPEPESESESP